MDATEIFRLLPSVLLDWYDRNQRILPWRQDRDPYHIWVSEIMLQQTRVEAVKGYYTAFINKLPTVRSLSNADDALLHKLWEGLGYYSRVRNLKKAACVIMEQYQGVFPQKYDQILALPGIGPYTAGAICSIAFNMPTPAVDGNVLRLVSRLTDDAEPVDSDRVKRRVKETLQTVYPKRSGDFTQALMELGATLCGPNGKPNCAHCPCAAFCLGHLRGTAQFLPVKTTKKPRRVEQKTVLILSCEGHYALVKRPATGLLASMWQFPDVPGKLSVSELIDVVEEKGIKVRELKRSVEKKHIFTHIEWDMCGYYLEIDQPVPDYHWFTPEQISTETALPTAYRQFWEGYEAF